MTTTAPTYAPFPPTTQQINTPNGNSSGTITNIASLGPCKCQIYSTAGVLLTSVDSSIQPQAAPGVSPLIGNRPFSISTSIAFSGGAPYVTQLTPSAITLTFE
jgi:hypothetical protein